MILALFLASQVLAQSPIEGWDKAKFGMSPEDLRNAYAEEERFYLEEEYYRMKDYWKGGWWIELKEPEEYLGTEKDKELEDIRMRDPFWEKQKENEFTYTPYTLHTRKLKVLGGEAEVWFYFVDNKLFRIKIKTTERESYFLHTATVEKDLTQNDITMALKFACATVDLYAALFSKYREQRPLIEPDEDHPL